MLRGHRNARFKAELGRFMDGLLELKLEQIEQVTAVRRATPTNEQTAAWYAVRNKMFSLNREGAWAAARKAKEGAWSATRSAGGGDVLFSYAAFDAVLGLGLRDVLESDHYETLTKPMSQMMPWLMGCAHSIPAPSLRTGRSYSGGSWKQRLQKGELT
jgi:hypothetical protein